MSRMAELKVVEPRYVLQARLSNARVQLTRAQCKLDGVTGDSHFDDRLRAGYLADVGHWAKSVELLEWLLAD